MVNNEFHLEYRAKSEDTVAEVTQLKDPLQSELLRESFHRITNQLSLLVGMIRLENQTVGNGPPVMTRESATLLLNDVAARIVSISQHHRRMVTRPQSAFDDLPALLVRCCSDLTRSLALTDRVRFRYSLGGECQVTGDEAFAIGLLVNEIAMNSIKHAEPAGTPTEISVSSRIGPDGRPEIEISDRGGGLPKGFDTEHDGGAGFQIIRCLARRMRADLIVESDDLGLAFRIVLPVRQSNRASLPRAAALAFRRANARTGANLSDRGVRQREMVLQH